MCLDLDRETFFRLEVQHDLIGVVIVAEVPERRPIPVGRRRRAEIAVECELSAFRADAKLVRIRIENLDAVFRGLLERDAMPCLFVRAVDARLGLPCPAGNLELGAARAQVIPAHPELDLVHVGVTSRR